MNRPILKAVGARTPQAPSDSCGDHYFESLETIVFLIAVRIEICRESKKIVERKPKNWAKAAGAHTSPTRPAHDSRLRPTLSPTIFSSTCGLLNVG